MKSEVTSDGWPIHLGIFYDKSLSTAIESIGGRECLSHLFTYVSLKWKIYFVTWNAAAYVLYCIVKYVNGFIYKIVHKCILKKWEKNLKNVSAAYKRNADPTRLYFIDFGPAAWCPNENLIKFTLLIYIIRLRAQRVLK